MERWAGKAAVVTGASTGIGASIAEALANLGLKVAGIARNTNGIEQLPEGLENKSGELHSFKADVTKEEEIVEAFTWVKNKFGPVHILVNSAGIGRPTTLLDGTAEDFRAVLDTNLLGTMIASREAIKHMRSDNVDGHIININSTSGHYVVPFDRQNIYAASKFAVRAVSETLRQELIALNSKIKITNLSPGMVRTNILEKCGYEVSDGLKDLLKNAPILNTEDIVEAALYVLGTPPHVQVNELIIRYTGEKF